MILTGNDTTVSQSDPLDNAYSTASRYNDLGKFDHELTTSSLEIIVSKGNHPQMAELFRLVNYYNLPRMIYFKSWDI